MMNIYYKNNAGEKLNLLSEPYRLQTGSLFNYAWDHEYKKYSSRAKITRFYKHVSTVTLMLAITGRDEESYYSAINRFCEVTERDVINNTPGRLCVGEQYLECFLTESSKTSWESGIAVLDNTVKLISPNPVWITEKHFSFQKKTAKEKISEHLDYPYDFEYDLLAEPYGLDKIEGGTSSDSHFKMIIYGPAVFPEVFIGGHKYRVNTVVAEGEYLTIDSREQTVVRCMIDGTKINEFDNREHEGHSVFKKIPAGNVEVEWNGSFGWDIMLFEERSEPRW